MVQYAPLLCRAEAANQEPWPAGPSLCAEAQRAKATEDGVQGKGCPLLLGRKIFNFWTSQDVFQAFFNDFVVSLDFVAWRKGGGAPLATPLGIEIVTQNQTLPAYSIVITACYQACWWKVDCVILFSERLLWKRLFQQKHYSQGAKKLPAHICKIQGRPEVAPWLIKRI